MADDADLPVALIPLADLYIHPLNTRTEPPPADIEALADSIAELGLLQNLAGFDPPDQPWDAASRSGIGIVAGGRRLRALQLLAQRDGRDPAEVRVPVRVTDSESTARLWASAENSARAALSPADEVRAYGRMAATGADPNRIARAFAVTERHVRQRLKLADLPTPALEALRRGEISLDQAAALTLAETAEQVDSILRTAAQHRQNGWAPLSAENIRRTLTPDAVPVSDRRAMFVGLAYYELQGGLAQRDLFSDQVRLLDPAKLDRLFREKLDGAAIPFRDHGGWAAVKVGYDTHFDYSAVDKMEEVRKTPTDLPEADQAEYDDLADRCEDNELTPAELARLDELEARIEGDWSDADRARSTLFLHVDHKGGLVLRAFAPKGGKSPAEAGDAPGTADTPAPEKISQAVLDDMRILRRLALQTALLDQTELALDLLAVSLTSNVYPWHKPLAISPTVQQLDPSKPDGTTVSDRLRDAVSDGRQIGDRRDLSPADLAEVQAMGKKARNAAITAALAAIFCRHDGAFADHLAARIGANVRKIWTPTADGYFSRLPVAALDRIWAELVPPMDGLEDAFLRQKKADKAKDLDQLFNSADYREAMRLDRATCQRIDQWLPAELQFGEVAA